MPSGLYDLLPPDAEKESRAVAQLLAAFSSFGYSQVSPPLMEFEASLLSGRGKELSEQTFRLTDPMAHEMMGIRADMTLQVARIAVSRLAAMPRPLRLCYAGQILQSRPEALHSERQLTQAGAELIGSDSINADVEIIVIAADSLAQLGIKDITIDINLPGLVRELCPEAHKDSALQAKIKNAVKQKNVDMAARLPIAGSKALASLIEATGPLEKALAVLDGLKIPHTASIRELAAQIARNCPAVKLTLDPIEYRGFDYHSGISFSIFAKGLRHELGRGGRYIVDGENATGFTIYVTHLLPLLHALPENKSVIVTQATGADKLRELRAQGWTTVYALTNNPIEEARLLGIKFQLAGDSKNIIEIK